MARAQDKTANSSGSTLPPSPTPSEQHPNSKGVFIFCDVRLYREGLVVCLSRQPSIVVRGAADISPRALLQVIELRPDVVILDVSGPTSFDIAKSLCARVPAIKIIAFAVKEIEQDVVACAVAGFAGYVPHDGSEADLMAAIDDAMCGELHCSPRVAGLLFRHLGVVSAPHPSLVDPTTLTQREQQVLVLLAQGMSNKEIAREAQISSATVKNHVHNILEKLQVRRRGEAAARLPTLQIARLSPVFSQYSIAHAGAAKGFD
jgi:two-component system nitrate/nitrite response regulator NarL